VFVANDAGLTAYVLHDGPSPRLSVAARAGHGGTSPVLAGGLLYVYDEQSPALRVYEPTRLRQLAALPLARTGHWNSPIVAGGRIIVPEGDANDHARGGTLEVYHLPGR
jgi:hypothetical protein